MSTRGKIIVPLTCCILCFTLRVYRFLQGTQSVMNNTHKLWITSTMSDIKFTWNTFSCEACSWYVFVMLCHLWNIFCKRNKVIERKNNVWMLTRMWGSSVVQLQWDLSLVVDAAVYWHCWVVGPSISKIILLRQYSLTREESIVIIFCVLMGSATCTYILTWSKSFSLRLVRYFFLICLSFLCVRFLLLAPVPIT